jgi:hypothetical protein
VANPEWKQDWSSNPRRHPRVIYANSKLIHIQSPPRTHTSFPLKYFLRESRKKQKVTVYSAQS